MKTAPTGATGAGAWIRLAALTIDGVMVGALLVGVFFVVKPLGPDSLHLFWNRNLNAAGTRMWLYALTTGVTLAWTAGFQAAVGTTPGMMLFGLKVVGPSGDRRPSVLSGVIRNLVILLAGVPEAIGANGWANGNPSVRLGLDLATLFGFGAIGATISRSPTRQGIHDRLAGGTYVVHRPRKTIVVR